MFHEDPSQLGFDLFETTSLSSLRITDSVTLEQFQTSSSSSPQIIITHCNEQLQHSDSNTHDESVHTDKFTAHILDRRFMQGLSQNRSMMIF